MSDRKALYLLAGHASKRDPALEAALAVAGVAKPKVAYIGAASGDNPLFFRWMKASLLKAGAGTVTFVKLAGRKSDPAKAVALLEDADCIHVGGGDVEAGMRVLESRGIVRKLRELYDAGRAFSGLSAGSIMLGSRWIRWRDPDDDSTMEAFPCLAFAPFPCDTHAEEDDFSELKSLLLLGQEIGTGYGIPSGSGLVLRNDGALAATAGSVRVYRKSGASVIRDTDIEP